MKRFRNKNQRPKKYRCIRTYNFEDDVALEDWMCATPDKGG